MYDRRVIRYTIYVAKRGKPAPAAERRMLLAARAEAALMVLIVYYTMVNVGDLQNEIGIDDVIHALEEDTE